MSFPNLPDNIGPINVNLSPEEVAVLLLASIAFEELGLAHIINTEGEKLQRAIGTLADPTTEDGFFPPLATTLDELLSVNRSVDRTLQTIIKKEMLLQFKFENILDFLATTTTTTQSPLGTCDCSLSPIVDVTIDVLAETVPPLFPPAALPLTGSTTVDYFINICSTCTAADNAFTYDYIRESTDPASFRQQFTASTFDTECVLDAAGLVVGMVVTGSGVATGANGGFSGAVNYILVLDEILNTATLTLINPATNLPVFIHGPQPLGIDISIEPCPTPGA